MTVYNEDRSFTDYVHTNLAVPIIYKKLNWQETHTDTSYDDQRDKKDGIDYQAVDKTGFKVTIQERFRDEYCKIYNDFTIRYTRDNSQREEEKQSEFFKIDASYFIYGVTNGKKFSDKRHTLTDFIKYVVFDVNSLKNLFRHGVIKVPSKFTYYSEIKNEDGKKVLYTAKIKNPDLSSEFIAIDPKKLSEILGSDISKVIIEQKGYY